MKTKRFAALAGMLLGILALSPAYAEGAAKVGDKLAWFQQRTIFKAGLRGTHTVALTFDDGPNENTRDVLAALKETGVKGTFFIVGKMAKAHPEVLREIADEGHLLANHTATHTQLTARYDARPKLLVSQIRGTHDAIAPLMQPGDTLFFRAPYGYWKSAHAKILNADPVLKNYVGPIYWDIGGETYVDKKGYVRTSADWDCWHRGWKASTCAKGYLRETRNKDGGVVLMHCISAKAGDLIRAVVPTLQREGFTFVRLDEIRTYDRYKTPGSQDLRPTIAMADPGPR